MSSLKSTSKAVGKLITYKNGRRRLMSCLQNNPELESIVQNRCFRSTGNIEKLPSSCQMVGAAHKDPSFLRNTSSGIVTQRRGFLGCGDGDEGSNVLSKVHEEKRTMGYSPEQLFAVVAAVDMYQDFLPWCQRSDIIQRHSDTSFDAELEIGFKFLVESYVSHVEMIKPKMIKNGSKYAFCKTWLNESLFLFWSGIGSRSTPEDRIYHVATLLFYIHDPYSSLLTTLTTSSQSSLFDHLINIWEFHPGPVPGTCDLHFFVDFKFQSPLYSQMASMFFKEVVSRLVNSFNDRCHLIYGPGVPVREKLMETGT